MRELFIHIFLCSCEADLIVFFYAGIQYQHFFFNSTMLFVRDRALLSLCTWTLLPLYACALLSLCTCMDTVITMHMHGHCYHYVNALALLSLCTCIGTVIIMCMGLTQLMCSLVTSIFLYACESWTLTAEIQSRIQAMDIRCYRKILCISYKDHVTNKEVCAKFQQAVGPH